MRRFSTFIFCVVLTICCVPVLRAQSLWVAQTSGTEAAIYSIDFSDAETAAVGFAVGENGTILRTTNGGLDWAACTSGTAETLYHVEAVDGSNVYACGSNGIILRSSDGGDTWSSLTIPSSLQGIGLDFYCLTLNPVSGVGYVCGSEQTILKTTDFGTSWTSLREGYWGAMYNVQMFGDDICVFTGKNSIFASLIGRTYDGGQNFTWRDFYPVDSLNVSWETSTRDAYFFTPESGLTVQVEELNGTGFITPTGDWSSQFWPAYRHTGEYLECIDLYNGFGLTGGGDVKAGGAIYESADNGTTWRISEVPDKTPYLHDVFVAGNTLFAVGDAGTILTRDKFVSVPSLESVAGDIRLSVNPASDKTEVMFDLKQPGFVSIALVDATGRLVSTPVTNRRVEKGKQQVSIALAGLKQGTYHLLITVDKEVVNKTLVVLH